jgi:AbrB family looped-hinge helix DNA binding protein
MNLGIISYANTKGQVVIPKAYRDELRLNETVPLNLILIDGGILMRPVKNIVWTDKNEVKNDSFLEVLKRTQGSWAGDDWNKTEKKRRKIELAAAKRRKNDLW